ncbi:hypothetical protein SUGI_0339590 [Cryptomeria japonica]|nr:hypothetical protein SUGI_0339590 [Cryptomeria japonica]
MNAGIGVSNHVGLSGHHGLGALALSGLGTCANLSDIENAANLMMVRMQVDKQMSLEQWGTKDFISFTGHLDRRLDLYHTNEKIIELESRYCADISVMASKLAYENESVVRNVVTKRWEILWLNFYVEILNDDTFRGVLQLLESILEHGPHKPSFSVIKQKMQNWCRLHSEAQNHSMQTIGALILTSHCRNGANRESSSWVS